MKKKTEVQIVESHIQLWKCLEKKRKFRFGLGEFAERFTPNLYFKAEDKLILDALAYEDCPIKSIKLFGHKDLSKRAYKSVVNKAIQILPINTSITSLTIGQLTDNFLTILPMLISPKITEVDIHPVNPPEKLTNVITILDILSTRKHITRLGINIDVYPSTHELRKLIEPLKKFPNLESFKFVLANSSMPLFGLFVLQVMAKTMKNLLNLGISSRGRIYQSFEEEFVFNGLRGSSEFFSSINEALSANPNLEKLTVCCFFNENYQLQLQSFTERVALCSNLTYFNISHNTIPGKVLLALLTNLKKLNTLICSAGVLTFSDTEDNSEDSDYDKLTEILKRHDSLKTMDFTETVIPHRLIKEILKCNSTVNRISFQVVCSVERYKKILEVLKYNTSITSFKCHPVIADISKDERSDCRRLEQQVIFHNKNLLEFNDYESEVESNKALFIRNKISISAFVKIFAKSTTMFTNYLPMEVWLRIAKFMNTPCLPEVDKLLLEAVRSYEQKQPSSKHN